jgi:hypothetical protein
LSALRTIAEHMARTFTSPPPERLLRSIANRANIGVKIGRNRYLTDAEWFSLLENAGQFGIAGARSPCGKRTAKSRGSELRNQHEKSQELERLGLRQTSTNTTTNKPTDRNRNQSPSQMRP